MHVETSDSPREATEGGAEAAAALEDAAHESPGEDTAVPVAAGRSEVIEEDEVDDHAACCCWRAAVCTACCCRVLLLLAVPRGEGLPDAVCGCWEVGGPPRVNVLDDGAGMALVLSVTEEVVAAAPSGGYDRGLQPATAMTAPAGCTPSFTPPHAGLRSDDAAAAVDPATELEGASSPCTTGETSAVLSFAATAITLPPTAAAASRPRRAALKPPYAAA